MKRPVLLALSRLEVFSIAVDPTPGADQPLDLGRRTRRSDVQQPRLRLYGGHAGDSSDLGVRQFPTGKGLGDERERGERACHADVLACGMEAETQAPVQPVGAGQKPVAPAAADVEVTDHVQEPGGGDLDVGGEQRDLGAQSLQCLDLGIRRRLDQHASPPYQGTLRPEFGAPRPARYARDRAQGGAWPPRCSEIIPEATCSPLSRSPAAPLTALWGSPRNLSMSKMRYALRRPSAHVLASTRR